MYKATQLANTGTHQRWSTIGCGFFLNPNSKVQGPTQRVPVIANFTARCRKCTGVESKLQTGLAEPGKWRKEAERGSLSCSLSSSRYLSGQLHSMIFFFLGRHCEIEIVLLPKLFYQILSFGLFLCFR